MLSSRILFSAMVLILSAQIVRGQDSVPAQTDIPPEVFEELFESEEALEMTLKFDLKQYQRTRKDGLYQDAEMSCVLPDSSHVRYPVRVKARGFYRRNHCGIPPMWLNIRYSGMMVPELEGIKRMKMVTRCRMGAAYDGYVLREYLVYKIYNLISPNSYRVRLVRLKYIDTGRKNRETQQWAFLIEPNKLLARRTNTDIVDSDQLAMRMLNGKAMNRLAMFQYMIGNGDYSVTGRHNLRILDSGTGGRKGYIPVPYDFDYTGIVNTHYAIPGDALGIESVRERYFMGPCRHPNEYQVVIQEFEELRVEIEAMIWDMDYLDENDRYDMIGYIESFFLTADNENFIEREIKSTCR